MDIGIVEETPDALPQYEKVSIAFRVESYLRVELCHNGLGGIVLIEEPVEPYIKDYDRNEKDKPSQWPRQWDITAWGILSAFQEGQRIGGAAVAWKTPEISSWAGGEDVACLWDLRVDPDYRNRGIGHQLFRHALQWAQKRDCHRFMVETQNINVPACRFYARQGCELGAINRCVYGELPDETQLLWYRSL